jgi:hypothetical protein
MNKKITQLILISLILIVILFIGSALIVNNMNDKNIESVSERLEIESVDKIVSKGLSNEDIFNHLTTRAVVLEGSGDVAKAEEYYVAALEAAKSSQDQNMIDDGYRLLLAYYKTTGDTANYEIIATELGEQGMMRVFEPDPRDSEIQYIEATE